MQTERDKGFKLISPSFCVACEMGIFVLSALQTTLKDNPNVTPRLEVIRPGKVKDTTRNDIRISRLRKIERNRIFLSIAIMLLLNSKHVW